MFLRIENLFWSSYFKIFKVFMPLRELMEKGLLTGDCLTSQENSKVLTSLNVMFKFESATEVFSDFSDM